MILVDDSGWGSLLGGVMIGVYDTDTRKFKSKLIPVSFFQGKKFTNALYRDKALSVFIAMNPFNSHPQSAHCCRGTVLDRIWDYLQALGFKKKAERLEIGDPLQSLLEEKFAQHLVKCGVPRKSSGAHCLSFNEQLEWIKEDPKRVKYVKTGWPSWINKYSQLIPMKQGIKY